MFNCFYLGHPYKFSLMEGLQDFKKSLSPVLEAKQKM